MSAGRIIDDHLELANIGTKTHAEIESHIQGIGNYAFPSADGALNQILETDGEGALSWVNKPAGFACANLSACSLSQLGTRPHSQLTGIGVSDHHTDHKVASAEDAQFKSVNIPLNERYKQNNKNLISFKSGTLRIGELAGNALTTGSNSVYMGYKAGYSSTITGNNYFMGFQSGRDNTSGQYNVFLGNSTGQHNVGGTHCVFIGNGSGYKHTSGDYNVFLGGDAGFYNLIGEKNVFIGIGAGANNVGSNNVFIGYATGCNETGSNFLYINNSIAAIPLIWGDFANHKVGIYMKPAVSKFGVAGIVEYADNATAVIAGLTAGEFYRTGDVLKIVH